LLSAIGANIRPNDPLALHYRHVAVSISRQLGAGQETKGILTIMMCFFCVIVSCDLCLGVFVY
jgi:hypothetical protein